MVKFVCIAANVVVDGRLHLALMAKLYGSALGKDLDEAKEIARDTYLEYKFRHKNDLPVITKKFADVARLAIADMRKQLDAGLGKKVYADYIVCIERYLIPYFGSQYVTSVDYEKVQSFYEWRRAKMGREPKASTLNTHNSAMNRVFDEAVARGFLAHKNVPMLVNKGEKSERRPDFTREEYATMIRKLPHWIKQGKAGQTHRHAISHAGLCAHIGQHGYAPWD